VYVKGVVVEQRIPVYPVRIRALKSIYHLVLLLLSVCVVKYVGGVRERA